MDIITEGSCPWVISYGNRYCPHCGKQVPGEDKDCFYCGYEPEAYKVFDRERKKLMERIRVCKNNSELMAVLEDV